MNGKQAKRIRREVMETFPAANLPDRLIEHGKGRPFNKKEDSSVNFLHGQLRWHNVTQRARYQQAKKSYKDRLKEFY